MKSINYRLKSNSTLQNSWCDWIDGQSFDYLVVFDIERRPDDGDDIDFHRRELLKRWHAQIDGQFISRRFHKRPLEQRTQFIAFPEPIGASYESVYQYHALVTPSVIARQKDMNDASIRTVFEETWRKITDNCSLEISSLEPGQAAFIAKQFVEECDHYIHTTRFLLSKNTSGNGSSVLNEDGIVHVT